MNVWLNKRGVAALVGINAILLLGALSGIQAAEKIVLKASDVHPLDYPTTQGLAKIGELLDDRTNGRIKVQIFPSGQLGGERTVLEKGQAGLVDLLRVSVGPVTSIVPELTVTSLPYIFRNETHQTKVLDGEIGQELLSKTEPYGLIGLGYYAAGQRSFYNSKRPIHTLEDLKGMKIRVMRAGIFMDMVRALGAIPSPMEWPEVYTGLQTGVIDGAENNYPSYVYSGHFENAKYYTQDEHLRVPEILLLSKKTYDKLSPQDQMLIKQAARDSIPFQRRLWAIKVAADLEKAKTSGTQIITDIDKQPFIDAMKPVYEKHANTLSEWIKRIQAVQ
ncbi:MAG: TRAP transporter substrate-binding protein [SAR324 cluster bacterium]|nr:TRAP transporter substrate-binding protein [SAR324 cluster bacterium]